jgi:hypothetical protein
MHRCKIGFAAATLLLFFAVAPLAAAENESQAAAPAAAQNGDQVAPAGQDSPGCPAGGKCCGSAPCAEAKRRAMVEGKAAMADCPCKRNLKKPAH